ncbi:magnesium/cobalt transporter CorA [Flavilitoribacter nigricans]|nr:magnesium/cobalt transporter CorA [Flavilitoribacter nigricans]
MPNRGKIGLPPGSLIFTGEKKTEDTHLKLIQYNESIYNAQRFSNAMPDIGLDPSYVTWLDVRGLHDVVLIEEVGRFFKIHPLALEDVLDTSQRPKFDEYDNGIFLIIRSLDFDESELEIETEQVGIFVGEHFAVSFQERAEDLFAPIELRLAGSSGKIRKRGSDYLAYALIDNMVDNYLVTLEKIEKQVDNLEEVIMANPESRTKGRIHELRLATLTMRKAVYPLREAINRFTDSDHKVKSEETDIFLRDLYDHTIQVMDMIETYRDMINGLYDLYLSEISFKMNNVMQVLTIISTIFIPLSFLAGVYGMNFQHMPELQYKYGYFVLWAIMITVAGGLMVFFRKKKWL